MPATLRTRQKLLAPIIVGLVVVACTAVAPVPAPLPAEQTAVPRSDLVLGRSLAIATAEVTASTVAVPTAFPLPPGMSTVAVQRGSIKQLAVFNGRVTGEQEITLGYERRMTPVTVSVKPGDAVTADQVVVQGETKDILKALQTARRQLETTRLRIDQSQSQANDRQRSAVINQRDAAAAAQENLRQAQSSFDAVQAGPSDVDKQAADAAVLTAQVAVDKARADLQRQTVGATSIQLADAEAAVATATAGLNQAEAEAAAASRSPAAADVRTAEQLVADAQTRLAIAQAELDALTRGPDPFDLRAAQREVDKAEARRSAGNFLNSSAQREADLDLEDARDRLAKLKQPPSTLAVGAAQNKVSDAKVTLANAQDKLEALRRPVDPKAVDRTKANVQAAKLALQSAHTRLQQLKQGASEDDIETAKKAVQAIELQLSSAKATQDTLYSRPTPAQLDEARRRLKAAQAVMDHLTAPVSSDVQVDPLLQKELETELEDVSQLEDELDATRLRAPADGYVVAVFAVPAQALEPGSPALLVARKGTPIVQVVLNSTPGRNTGVADPMDVASQVAVGQTAVVQLDGGEGKQFDGSVSTVSNGSVAGSRVLQIKANWASATPGYGLTGQVQVAISEKRDVLVVPRAAITTSGSRSFVDYIEGGARKVTEVKLGAINETHAEVLSGLILGQLVLARGIAADQLTTQTVAGPTAAAPQEVPASAAITRGTEVTPVATAQATPVPTAAAVPTLPPPPGSAASGRAPGEPGLLPLQPASGGTSSISR